MSQYDFEYSVIYALWGGEEQGLHGSATTPIQRRRLEWIYTGWSTST